MGTARWDCRKLKYLLELDDSDSEDHEYRRLKKRAVCKVEQYSRTEQDCTTVDQGNSINFLSEPISPAADKGLQIVKSGSPWVLSEGSTDRSEPTMQFPHPAPSLISTHWASTLLMQCARAISGKQVDQVKHLLWVINRLASPYGDSDQRIASYFLHALHCTLKGDDLETRRAYRNALERRMNFEVAMKVLLMLREATPWLPFAHVATNGAFLEAFEGQDKVHIVDVSHWSFCVQWPTLIEALATRPGGPPQVHITVVILRTEHMFRKVVNEAGARLKRFATLMGVSLGFDCIQEPDLRKLKPETLGVRPGEALAISLSQTLHYMPTAAGEDGGQSARDEVIQNMRRSNPKVVAVVEDEVDQETGDFADKLSELYRFMSAYVGSMEGTPIPKQRRLDLEQVAKLVVMENVAQIRDDAGTCMGSYERREKTMGWTKRFLKAGFQSFPLTQDSCRSVQALVSSYPPFWGILTIHGTPTSTSGFTLTWHRHPVVSVTLWQTPPSPHSDSSSPSSLSVTLEQTPLLSSL